MSSPPSKPVAAAAPFAGGRAAPPPPRPFSPIRAATSADAADIAVLLDAAFGAERMSRTASLLRANASPISGVSLVARDVDERLIGSIQYWPIALIAVDEVRRLTLLGPVAVSTSARSLGLGRQLLAHSLGVADAAVIDPILLIGDASYYSRFGFTATLTGGWTLPGPFDPARLLLRQRGALKLPRAGDVIALASLPATTATSVGDDG